MKIKSFIISISLVILPIVAVGQVSTDELVSNCVVACGEYTTYLKDFRVQLPKAAPDAPFPVYKAHIYLMKNIKYRFAVCNAPESAGELVVKLYEQGKELISSYSTSTGKKYNSIDFICNKTGLYTLWFDFINGEQGSGVGIVLMIK
jgi:hypothetical protein